MTARPNTTTALVAAMLLGGAALAMAPSTAQGQWSRTYEQMYLPGAFNFTFRRDYMGADRLFNAFDYGHAILYERLLNEPNADPRRLEEEEYRYITETLLVRPPRLPLEEAAIEVNYARLAPEAKQMFDWAHLLHRQLYDVLASEEMSAAEKDAMVARLVAYYKTRPDLAFSSVPKNMDLMEAQPYSLAFRQRYPKFNGLIWGYHWLQVGLYEPLLTGTTHGERQAGVAAAVARFRQMLEKPAERFPRIMPMTGAIAPTFAARYEEAAIIFDNLHSMHDVVSDILANPAVPRGAKRRAILEAAERYRDATSFVMPAAEWRAMAAMMGVENMGGAAVGVLSSWATPTVPPGSTMAEAMKLMPGMTHGAPTPAAGAADPHAGHGAPAPVAKPDSAANPHAAHLAPAPAPAVTPDPAANAHAGHVAPAPAAKPALPTKPAATKKKAAPARKDAPTKKKASARKPAPPPPPTDHSKMGHQMPSKTP